MLIYLGAFAEKNAFEDMIIVLFFGGLGWIMEKLEWPRPPVLLGLVLGPLAENQIVSYPATITDWHGLGRPGVLIIFAVTLFGIFYPIIKKRREEKEKLASKRKLRLAVEAASPRRPALQLASAFHASLSRFFLRWRSGRAEILVFVPACFPG